MRCIILEVKDHGWIGLAPTAAQRRHSGSVDRTRNFNSRDLVAFTTEGDDIPTAALEIREVHSGVYISALQYGGYCSPLRALMHFINAGWKVPITLL